MGVNIEMSTTLHTNKLINIIVENEHLICFDYKKNKNQIAIEGELRTFLYDYLHTIKATPVEKKELLKRSVFQVLELEEQDLILIKKNQIFIKMIEKKEELSKDKRFNGYSKEELDSLYNEYFENKIVSEFLLNVTKEVFLELFKKKKITNSYYEKNIYPIIQNNIALELHDINNSEIEFRKGFAGYIFRVNFLDVFKFLSDDILSFIYQRNEYILSWLNYYNGQIFIDQGKKYISPELRKDDKRWNPVSIYGNISIWFKIKDRINRSYINLTQTKDDLQTLVVNNKTPLEQRKELLNEYSQLQQKLNELKTNIEERREYRRKLKNRNNLLELNDEITTLQKEIAFINKTLQDLSFHLNNTEKQKKYKQLNLNKTVLLNTIEKEKKRLNEHKDSYSCIQSSLIKALTSKRKMLEPTQYL